MGRGKRQWVEGRDYGKREESIYTSSRRDRRADSLAESTDFPCQWRFFYFQKKEQRRRSVDCKYMKTIENMIGSTTTSLL